MDLGAVVSTGADVWSLKVRGQLVNETWNNIGVNWSPYKNDTDLPYSERGGLEVKMRYSLIFETGKWNQAEEILKKYINWTSCIFSYTSTQKRLVNRSCL